MAVDCKCESRQGKERPEFLKISKEWKSETEMTRENKMKKSIDNICQNVSCLLLQLKSWLEKDAISAGPKKAFCPAPPPLIQQQMVKALPNNKN